MNLSAVTDLKIRRNVALASFVTMQVGGRANYFAEPTTAEELAAVLVWAQEEKLPHFILGKGSNVVFDDEGYDGVVISMLRFRSEDLRREGSDVIAGAGVHLYRLAKFCCAQELAGGEFFANIPGTVGGAVFMNAGFSRIAGKKNETADVLKSVRLMDSKGREQILLRSQLIFGYRKSKLPANTLVTEARFTLRPGDKTEIAAEMQANFDYRNTKQDLKHPSSGSVFKNPPAPCSSAGLLIERNGLKGKRIGGMMVSEKHGNYFINAGKGTCQDLKNLIEEVQTVIFVSEGIRLEPEVRIIPSK
ncbi:MAG TPA: UDP-N-acetylmuramate dehydrogenase [Candidatus Omnitrophota bacterium]|nr:UDP-N-acetylmuramate dehydrogenase [Candidatus Omnitrophota bacterium]